MVTNGGGSSKCCCGRICGDAESFSWVAQPISGSLGTVIGAFKSAVTKRINKYRIENDLPIVRVWQRNYHEHIIRDEKELDDTRSYIIENPANWANDENYLQP